MPLSLRLPLALSLTLLPPALAAQEHDHAHGAELGKLGRVVFPVSCAAEARPRFEHAMAVLHSFWWEEGDRAFGAVLAADSGCAMGYWGIALNAWGNPLGPGPTGASLEKGTRAVERASSLSAPSARERGFIAAAAALYRDAEHTPNAARLRAYADTMTRLHRDFPQDLEITIYYALSLVVTAPRTDTTFARQKQAIAILEPLYARYPDHPGLAHYVIHAADSPALARLGISAARRYARIAPVSPHAQHMPSHIFVRLGLWDETIASNLKSYQAGIAYAKTAGLPGATPHELHALDYAVYGYLQEGRDSAARAAVKLAEEITTVDTRALIAGYNRTAMRARIPLERGDWAAAAAFTAPADTSPPVAAALRRFTRAIGSARSGRPEAAGPEVAALDSLAGALDGPDPYWARVVRIKRDAAGAWTMFATGDTTRGLALARIAADSEEVTDKAPTTPSELLPARELEGDMLLAAGRYREAREEYLATLAREPHRARSTFGAARAAELAGDSAAAATGYREFLQMMEKGDGKRPELAVARGLNRGGGSP
jgi:tetratricopeptide (TPR) repeat protein